MQAKYTPHDLISIRELASTLKVSEGRLREALRIHAVEKTASGAPAITGRMVLRLLERAVDLEMHLPPPGDWMAPAKASPNRRKAIPPKVRKEIIERDGSRCRYCGRKGNGHFHIDHLISVRYGGGHDPVNLVTSCAPCNARKGTGTVADAGMRLRPCPSIDGELNHIQQCLAAGDMTPLYPESKRKKGRSQ